MNSLKKYVQKPYLDIFLVSVAVLIGIYFDWQMKEIVVAGGFVWFVLNPLDKKRMSELAIYLLLISIIAFALNKDDRSLDLSLAAFFLLLASLYLTTFEKKSVKK